MSIMFTRLMESKGIGPAHAGNALGVALVGMQLGGAIFTAYRQRLGYVRQGPPFPTLGHHGVIGGPCSSGV